MVALYEILIMAGMEKYLQPKLLNCLRIQHLRR